MTTEIGKSAGPPAAQPKRAPGAPTSVLLVLFGWTGAIGALCCLFAAATMTGAYDADAADQIVAGLFVVTAAVGFLIASVCIAAHFLAREIRSQQ